ncbi:hypothetical protein SEA_ALLEYCAT_49 [Mycobacterium phage AlleyCat]|uniref:Uncharacterized protein n=2 Tax=Kratiovirus larva TaxID=1056831 RepID=A0A221J781_9CAUD|nr:hypothetical protein SEA_ALLEYCAT_49 [Mycobacterium phage AlleyCat]QQV92650.1 hypothetical protein SEA_PSYCHO_47 [Mycobacterium phage Psycho]WAB09730.1 hypothetical protein SEA_DADOSKY_49 [Mycobacterium phage Dadosky]
MPCSPKHRKGCSQFHSNLVTAYRLERHYQEVTHEATLSNQAELKLARENGFRLITFRDWLAGVRGCGETNAA